MKDNNGFQHNTSTTHERDSAFDDKVNSLGRLTSIIALCFMFSVPIIITIFYKIEVNVAQVMAIGGSLIAMFLPAAIVENISYYAIIGAGGVYLSCVTGNIMNMKLPSALSGMKIANVEPGSKEGDVISILSIAVSSVVTSVILFLGMFIIGKFLLPYLSHPFLKPGFDNIMPSLMGALIVPFIVKNGKISITPIIIALALCILFGPLKVQRYQSYLLPVIMLSSVAASYAMYKKGIIGKK